MDKSKEDRLLTQCRVFAEQGEPAEHELKKWNEELGTYVQEQTIELTRQNEENAALYRRMKSGFKDFTITISNLIELRDRSVANHSNSVAMLSTAIARKIGFDEGETETVAVAAQLHDIGKIGISDTVLLKDIEALAPYELEEYRAHPVRGQVVLASNEILRDAGDLIRHHHEAFDGTGFPDGLKGEDIPRGSRIIAIADTYDRLLLTRTPDSAFELMRTRSTKHLDPVLFSAFKEIIEKMAKTDALRDRTVEVEVHPSDLTAGMVVSRDVRSGTGLLLITKGVILNPRRIDTLQRHYRLDPPKTGVYVRVDRHKDA